jgi:hypothetical protein
LAIQLFSKRKLEFDPGVVRDQLYMLQRLWQVLGAEKFCALLPIWILKKEAETKEEKAFLEKRFRHWNKKLVPFVWNRMQQEIYAQKAQNNIVLKYRQGGTTTWFIIIMLYMPAVLEPGTSSLLVSQTNLYGSKHFEILKRAHRHFAKRDPFDNSKNGLAVELHQHLLHLQASNRRELILDALDSRILVMSAEDQEVGQGLPGVGHLCCTEVSRWPHNPQETMSNVTESVAPSGTKDQEWTANGLGGYAFEEYQKAKKGNSIYKAHFFPWPYADEYTIEDKKEQVRWIKSKEELTEEEINVQKIFDLTLGQIAWRRMKMVALGEDFFEKYPEDDISAFLLVGGRPFFEKSVVRERLLWTKANVKPVDVSDNGAFVLFKRAIRGRRYILFADVAEGKTISTTEPDASAFTVIDEQTGDEMASYADRIPPEDYAYVLKDIAHLFNDALIGVENNPGGGGETVLVTLSSQLGYGNIYKHRVWYKPPPSQGTARIVEVPGLPTTPKTRPIMLNRVAFLVREQPEIFLDSRFWQEASTFVRNEKGIPAAAEGCFDDHVMCRAGAHYVRLVQLGLYDPLHAPSEKYGEREAIIV